MTREETTALFARRQDALNRHDVAGLATLFAENCVVESPTAGGVVQGLPTVEAIHRAWVTGFPDVVFATEDLLIDGDRVAWIVRAAGTDTGGFMGFPPTGRAFEVPMVLLATLDDRHIVHERRIYDFTGMLVQIGILKAKATGSMAPLARFGAPASESSRPSEADAGSAMTREDVVHLLARRDEVWGRHDVALLAEQQDKGGDVALRDKVRSLLHQGRRHLLIDLAQVSYVDSARLGELVSSYVTAKNAGGSLKLVNVTKRLKDLLTITKLVTVFETHDTEAAALASFSSASV
jgi:anti-sigma B factor antagonist